LKCPTLIGFYFTVYKISCYNWLLTNNISIMLRVALIYNIGNGMRFILNEFIFQLVVEFALLTYDNTTMLPYPCLLKEYLSACPSYLEVKTDKIIWDFKFLKPPLKKSSVSTTACSIKTPFRNSLHTLEDLHLLLLF
jgi:hypothetical protein